MFESEYIGVYKRKCRVNHKFILYKRDFDHYFGSVTESYSKYRRKIKYLERHNSVCVWTPRVLVVRVKSLSACDIHY